MGLYSIGDALQKLSKEGRLSGGLKSAKIEDVWESIMGKTIAKYTQQIKLVHSTLFITTNMAALKNELYYQKPLIMQKINETLGKNTVTNIVIN